MQRRALTLVAVAVAVPVLAIGVVLLGSGSPAQSQTTRTLTFKELEKGSTFTHIRNTKGKSPRANSAGDLLAFTNPVADPTGVVVGKLHVSCTTTVGARNFLKSTLTCLGVLSLRDGTLTLQANSSPGIPTTTGAVTGGTGAYANVRGVYVSKEARGGSDTTISLAG
jgi:hypothetical protein